MTELQNWIDARIAQSKNEIVEDMRTGVVPMFVRSFSTLHDYVDANEYGGLCDEDVRATFPNLSSWNAWLDAGNAVQDAVHKWLCDNGSQDVLLTDARMVWDWHHVADGDKREFHYAAHASDVHALAFVDADLDDADSEELVMHLSTTSGHLDRLRVDLTEQYAERDDRSVSPLLFAVQCVEATVADGWL